MPVAITNPTKVGRTRKRLAKMLEEALREDHGIEAAVAPSELDSQNPYYASRHMDCCNWYGYGDLTLDEEQPPIKIHFYSWNRMGECIEHGITLEKDDMPFMYEVHAGRLPDAPKEQAGDQ